MKNPVSRPGRVRVSVRNFSPLLSLGPTTCLKCPLCAKIFLGAGDTKILKGVKKAGDKINTEKSYRGITSL